MMACPLFPKVERMSRLQDWYMLHFYSRSDDNDNQAAVL